MAKTPGPFWTTRSAARDFGVHHTTVVRWLRRLGVTPTRAGSSCLIDEPTMRRLRALRDRPRRLLSASA